MSSHQATTIIVLLAGILLVMCMPFFQAASPTPVVGWEYKISAINDIAFDSEMNSMGEKGWELVFARRATSGGVYSSEPLYECIFKRQAIVGTR